MYTSKDQCSADALDIIQTQFASYCEKTYDVNSNTTIWQTTTCSSGRASKISHNYFADSLCTTAFDRKPTVIPVPEFGKCYDASVFGNDFNGLAFPICQE